MPVTADTDLTALTVAQINELLDDAGSEIIVDGATYIGRNASDEYQWEVTYTSPQTSTYVTNHAFVDVHEDGDPFVSLNDLVAEPDIFAE